MDFPKIFTAETSDKGFILIEAMITLAIITIGILGINKLQVTALNFITRGAEISNLSRQGESVAEYIRNFDYDDSALEDGLHTVASGLTYNVTTDTTHNIKKIEIEATRGERTVTLTCSRRKDS